MLACLQQSTDCSKLPPALLPGKQSLWRFLKSSFLAHVDIAYIC